MNKIYIEKPMKKRKKETWRRKKNPQDWTELQQGKRKEVENHQKEEERVLHVEELGKRDGKVDPLLLSEMRGSYEKECEN